MRIVLTVVCVLLVLGCSDRRRTSIFGNWQGEMMTVTDSARHESVSEPVEKFGYLKLHLAPDSSYEFNFGVLKDVKVERPVFGMEGNVVLVKAVYKSARFGKFRGQDSGIVLPSKEGSIFVTPDSDRTELRLRFTDENNRAWVCTLVATE